MQRIPRTHDVSFFLDLHDRGLLNLNPPYQRRSVWTRRDKEYFIDTVLKNYPSPAVFIHKTTDNLGKSMFHVVDGKQRLETIIEFTKGKIRIPREFGDDRLNGKKWEDLSSDDKRQFWDYSISVEFLPVVDDAVVNSVFERINRNSRKLTNQELRHAKFDGWFSEFVEAQATDEDWETIGVVTKARAKRMADVQFLAELLIVVLHNDIVGFDHDVIDTYYADFEDPDEVTMPLTTDEISSVFGRSKSILREMCTQNPVVRDSFKTLANIYTLWCYLVLCQDKLGTANELSAKYAAFIDRVSEFQRNNVRPISNLSPERELDTAASNYAANLAGASTDITPRRLRFEALKAGFELQP